MEERNRSVKNAASKELYKLLLFFFFFFFYNSGMRAKGEE